MLKRYFFLALLAFTSLSHANSASPSVTRLLAPAERQQLASTAQWLALGHYKDIKGERAQSYVDDPAYFLHPKGERRPALELQATLQALDTPFPSEAEQQNQHPRCRFPARYTWLQQQLNTDFNQTFGLASCPMYQEWHSMINAAQVTLIYAAAHLNGPSSMYGHTLLRLDPPADQAHSDWLSWAVNFGAHVPAGDNSIMFAWRGIFGGYPGLFNVMPYFEKIQEYGRMEDRDLWEYQLNLSPAETERLVAHLWELKNINFAYYFFDENCSYRLLELLEIARPGTELTDDFPLFAIPVDTVRTVVEQGFVDTRHYRPSINTRLKAQTQRLNPTEAHTALQLITSAEALNSEAYQQLDAARKGVVAQTAYRFVHQNNKKKPRTPALAEHSFQLLTAMNAHPVSDELAIPPPDAPELGHDSSMWGLSLGQQDSVNFVDAELRLSFHNLTDRYQGFLPGAAIDMGKLVVRQFEHESIELQELTLIDIHSSSPRNRFFKPLSWKVKFGAERQRMTEDNVLATHVTGGAGASYQWGDFIGYGLLMAKLEHNRELDDTLNPAVGGNAGIVHYAHWGNSQFDYDYFFFDSDYQRSSFNFKQSIVLGKNTTLRLDASYIGNSDEQYGQFALSIRQHF